MDRTRASLRRVRVYVILLLVCAVYAALPVSDRENAKAHARQMVGDAINWAVAHVGRIEQ